LNGGGSYIRIDEDGIESATMGDYVTKAGYYDRKKKARQVVETPELPTLEPDSNYRLSSIKSTDETRSNELIFKPFSGGDTQ
ncbi:hypothetical protein JK232_11685, partial [Nissabacter archeti]|nr:hypothetical protein [Nissabacter archeti]